MKTEATAMDRDNRSRLFWTSIVTAGVMLALSPTEEALAGRFIFGDTTHPDSYNGEGGTKDIEVCWRAGTPAERIQQADRSFRNAIARWNRLQPVTANVRRKAIGDNQIDFESVAVHELGHCLGLGHPNLGSVVGGGGVNATAALRGPNGQYDLNPGSDGRYGTRDDVRGDDQNLYIFRKANNNPFTMADVVDGTTYSSDVAQLPAGHLFPVNAQRLIGSAYGVHDTDAAMQHDIFPGQSIRQLTHDDVSALRYAMSGLDETQGTTDDYRSRLVYRGETGDNCDITIEYSNDETAAASCRVRGVRPSGQQSVFITEGRIFINDSVDWAYAGAPPCNESTALPQNKWVMFSPPCDLGISTSAKVRDVLGDDLGTSNFGSRWNIYAFEYPNGGNGAGDYRVVGLDDKLESGRGYWLITLDANKRIDVSGEYPAQVDVPLGYDSAKGLGWNLVGNPFRYASTWNTAQVVTDSGRLLSVSGADPKRDGRTACSAIGGPTSDCTMLSIAYQWDHAQGRYRTLTQDGGDVSPFSALWVAAVKPKLDLRLGMPAVERHTR